MINGNQFKEQHAKERVREINVNRNYVSLYGHVGALTLTQWKFQLLK